MARDDLVNILMPEVRKMHPPEEKRHLRATLRAVDESGDVAREALRQALPWQARDFHIAGAVIAGSNVTEELRVRQASRIVYLDALAKTAPAPGPLTIWVDGGAASENVSIAAGQSSGTSSANIAVAAGAVLRLNVTAANGAEGVTVTVWLVPDTE